MWPTGSLGMTAVCPSPTLSTWTHPSSPSTGASWTPSGSRTRTFTTVLIPISTPSRGPTSSWGFRRMATSPIPSGQCSNIIWFWLLSVFNKYLPYFTVILFKINTIPDLLSPHIWDWLVWTSYIILIVLHHLFLSTASIHLFLDDFVENISTYCISTQNFDHKWKKEKSIKLLIKAE